MPGSDDFDALVAELYETSAKLDDKGNIEKFHRLANYLYSIFMGNISIPLSPSEEKFVATLCSATNSGLEYWRGVGDTLSRLVQVFRVRGFDPRPSELQTPTRKKEEKEIVNRESNINRSNSQPSFLD